MRTRSNLLGAKIIQSALAATVASIMVLGSSAFGDVAVTGVATGTAWTSSSTNGGALQLATELPNDVSSQIGIGTSGGNGQVGAETFTTGSLPFVLNAISIATNGTSAAITSGLSIHLYALNSTTTTASGGYTPNTAVATTATNTTGDLLGVNGSGVGQGLNVSLANPTPAEVLEFDLSNGTTNDQITLAPNTLYSFEVWDTTSTTLLWNRATTPAYSGGQAYATGSGNNGAAENSTVSRNQLVGSPRFADLAIYGSAVPEPASMGLLGLASMVMLGRRKNRTV